jgi:hypothetical protein
MFGIELRNLIVDEVAVPFLFLSKMRITSFLLNFSIFFC